MNVTLSGSTRIRDNSMTGLTASGGVIGIHGNIDFINNTGVFGGAMNLRAFSFLVFTSNSSLRMINNTALVLGGALYVDLESNEYFEQCFLYFGHDQIAYCSDCSNLELIVAVISMARHLFTLSGQVIIIQHMYIDLNQLFPTVFNFDKLPKGVETL